jgi:hypothetical protein
MEEYIKIYTGSSITVNKLAFLLDEENIASIIKDKAESSRLAGFGANTNSVEVHILNSQLDKAKKVLDVFTKENIS